MTVTFGGLIAGRRGISTAEGSCRSDWRGRVQVRRWVIFVTVLGSAPGFLDATISERRAAGDRG